MVTEFHRLQRLPPYVFAEVTKLKMAARGRGEDIIDFGMGNPDLPPPAHVIEKLRETALDPRAHRYSISRGIAGLRRAQAGYYQRRFGVELDPETEVIVTLGSKEGLANLAHAITRPGDRILVPNPSYPIHPYGFVLSEGTILHLPRTPGLPFLQQLKTAIETSEQMPIAVVLNYPCNPTTEVVTLDFYEAVVDLCRHYGIYILSDLAYCEIYFDGNPPPSVLQVKGAKDIAVEFTTLSKTYSMAGWRMGFTCGNKTLVAALTKIKSYLDYGAFTPIQVAATAAINGPQGYVEEIRGIYKERRDALIDGMHKAGWMVESPKASMFVWAPIPEKFAHLGSLEFSKRLLNHASVAVAPGVGFGEHGDGHVRIALVENPHRIRQATRAIKKFLNDPMALAA